MKINNFTLYFKINFSNFNEILKIKIKSVVKERIIFSIEKKKN